FAHCAEAEADLLLIRIHLDDLEVMLLAGFELHRNAVRIGSFGDVAQAFNTFRDFNKRTELRRPQNLAVNHISNAVLGEERLPYIGLELLDAQRQAAVLRLHAQHYSTNFLALLQDFRRMLDALGPAQV